MVSGLRSKNYLISVALLRDGVPSFDEYPFNIPAIRHLGHLEFDQPVTFLVGENGSGKSTLLEAIAVAWGLNPEGGSRNFAFSTRASHSTRTGVSANQRRSCRAEMSGWAPASSCHNGNNHMSRSNSRRKIVWLFSDPK